MVALDGLLKVAFVTHDEPLFGLECQESVRDLVPFFSGFVDYLNGCWRGDSDRNGFRTARAILSCSYVTQVA